MRFGGFSILVDGLGKEVLVSLGWLCWVMVTNRHVFLTWTIGR